MLPLEIILTKRSSRNAKAMYKGGRGSEGGGNRNYFNAIKYHKWFYIDKELRVCFPRQR